MHDLNEMNVSRKTSQPHSKSPFVDFWPTLCYKHKSNRKDRIERYNLHKATSPHDSPLTQDSHSWSPNFCSPFYSRSPIGLLVEKAIGTGGNIKTTQIYVKITNIKTSKDMGLVENQISRRKMNIAKKLKNNEE